MRDLRLTVGDYASSGGGHAPNPCVMGCAHLFLGSLFVFGEGGGGSEGGRVESRLAVSAVLANFRGSATVEPRARLREALEHAGQVLFTRSQSATAFRSAWARCVAVLVRRNRLYTARVGDLYLALVRGGRLEPMFEAKGPAETRLGQPGALEVEIREEEIELKAGDRFILSNGALTSAVDQNEIGRLASSLVPAVAARRLVEAVERGDQGNPVSVQVVQAGEMPLGTSEPVPPAVLAPTPPLPRPRKTRPRSVAAPAAPAPPAPMSASSITPPPAPPSMRRTTDSSSEIALEYSRHETRPNWLWFAGLAVLGVLAFALSTAFPADDADDEVELAGPVTPDASPGAPAGAGASTGAAEVFWSSVSARLEAGQALSADDVQALLGAPDEASARLREAQAVVAALEAARAEQARPPAVADGEDEEDPVGDSPAQPTALDDSAEDETGDDPAEEVAEAVQPVDAPAAAAPTPEAAAPEPATPEPVAVGAWNPTSLPRGLRGFERIFSMEDTDRAAERLKRYIHTRHRHVERVFKRLDDYLDRAPKARSIAILRKLPRAKAGPKTRRWARQTIVRLKRQ